MTHSTKKCYLYGTLTLGKCHTSLSYCNHLLENYEYDHTCNTVVFSGCEPLVQLRDILASAPGVYGARFSGAGFRGCCVALVAAGFYITHLELLYYRFLMITIIDV